MNTPRIGPRLPTRTREKMENQQQQIKMPNFLHLEKLSGSFGSLEGMGILLISPVVLISWRSPFEGCRLSAKPFSGISMWSATMLAFSCSDSDAMMNLGAMTARKISEKEDDSRNRVKLIMRGTRPIPGCYSLSGLHMHASSTG